ncbi:MAG: ABC transporter ATP-binding protein [Candidatus Diapherotrites archaeon]|nr:ABC transporter ATP-binding protein [Candidatus Diapherotrites archaeon]
MRVELEKISVSFSNWKMQNFSLKVPDGGITSIVGPSGSGKTTILRVISGLQHPESGKIFFGKKEVTELPAEKRNAGFVFQNEALFYHLNVFENVAFGLRMKKEKNLQEKVLRALKIVHLAGFENRNIQSLSGGEKKRVAIARAIAFEPDLLLLDEPLNGLDAKLKESTKKLLKELQEKTGLSMVFVTHDIDEAFYLGDEIVVINSGKLEQAGSPKEIFLRPKNGFVKEFVSDYLLVKGKIADGKIDAKFSFSAKKEKGTPFFAVKKNNYKFLEK